MPEDKKPDEKKPVAPTLKVRLLTSMAGNEELPNPNRGKDDPEFIAGRPFAWSPGHVVTLPRNKATNLINAGFAEEVV